MLSRFCRIFLLTLVVALCVTVAQAKNVALLVEEIPGTPMRIETTNLASLISEIDSDATILYATQDGVVDRELKPVDSKDFAATWVYSDAPLDSNSAFSAPNVAQWLSESQCGLILAGSAAALAQTLGFDPNLCLRVFRRAPARRNDASSTGIRYGSSKPRIGNPRHCALEDRILDTKKFCQSCSHNKSSFLKNDIFQLLLRMAGLQSRQFYHEYVTQRRENSRNR